MYASIPYFRALLVALAVFVGVSAGGASAGAGPAIRQEATLAVTDLKTLDPALATGGAAGVAGALVRGLVRLDTEGRPQPELAQTWEISRDRKTYIFHLREAVWSHGGPVTAADFRYAWIERALDPRLDAPDVALLFHLRGARELYESRVAAIERGEASVRHGSAWVTALAPDRLRVQLEHPIPYFLELLAQPVFAPVCSRTMRERETGPLAPDELVVNGPYRVAAFAAGEHAVLEKNPSYWAAEAVALERVRVEVHEAATAAEALARGRVDLTPPLPDPLAFNEHRALRAQPGWHTVGLWIHPESTALAGDQVRRALALAIDRKALARQTGYPAARPACNFAMREAWIQPPEQLLPETAVPAQARRLLQAAGEPGRLTLRVEPTQTGRALGEALAAQWREALELDVTLVTGDAFDLELMHLGAPGADPAIGLAAYRPLLAAAGLGDDYAARLENGQLLADADRERALHEIEGWLGRRLPFIPLLRHGQVWMAAEGFDGRLDPMGRFDLAEMTWHAP